MRSGMNKTTLPADARCTRLGEPRSPSLAAHWSLRGTHWAVACDIARMDKVDAPSARDRQQAGAAEIIPSRRMGGAKRYPSIAAKALPCGSAARNHVCGVRFVDRGQVREPGATAFRT
jgi:hypothetical protein